MVNRGAAILLALAPALAGPAAAAGAAGPEARPGAPAHDAVILEEDLSLVVRSVTDARERYRRRVQILTPKGAEAFGSDGAFYAPGVSILRMEGSVTLPSGKVLKAARGDFQDGPAMASFELYADSRYRLVRMPGVVPGAIVEFTYEKSLTNLFYLRDLFLLQDVVPAKLRTLSLSTVPSVPFRFAVKGGEPRHVVEEGAEATTHRWEVRDVAEFRIEDGTVPVEDLIPRIELTPSAIEWAGRRVDLTSWNGVARFYWSLASDRMTPGPEVARAAGSLAEGAGGPAERIRRVFEFVQGRVNYVAIGLGIGGWQPHPSADVLRYRYGDCKDKATLALAMLGALGLQGWPVLINTRDAGLRDPDLPVLGFNHAILAVPSEEGYLFLDPTSTTTEFGDLPWVDQGASALVVRPDGTGEFLTTPLAPPERNSRRFALTAEVGPTGALDGTLVMGVRGQRKAELAPLIEAGATRRQEEVAGLLADFVPGARMRSHRIEPAAGPGEEMRIAVDFAIPGFVTRGGDLEFLSPHVVKLHAPGPPAAGRRSQPIFVPFLFSDTVEARIALPPGRVLKKVPAEFTAREAGMEASSRYELLDRDGRTVLALKRSLAAGRREISPADHAAYRAFVSAVSGDESRAVTLVRGE